MIIDEELKCFVYVQLFIEVISGIKFFLQKFKYVIVQIKILLLYVNGNKDLIFMCIVNLDNKLMEK